MLTMSNTAERLGAALRKIRGSVSQVELASAIGEAQNWVSRRESGEVELMPSEIARIEAALACRPGTLYTLAGLVEVDLTTRAAIASDPLIEPSVRDVMLVAYDQAVASHRGRKRTRRKVSGE